MAVVENADSSNRADSVAVDHSVSNHFSCHADPTFRSNDLTDFHVAVKNHQLQQSKKVAHYANGDAHGEGAAEQMKLVLLQQPNGRSINGDGGVQKMVMKKNKGQESYDNNNDNEINDLQKMFSKLNPMAEEFVPPSVVKYKPLVHHTLPHFNYVAADNNLVMHTNSPGNSTRRKKNNYGHAKRRTSSRTSMAQREEIIKRTVYVSDIDQQVTEEQLAALFTGCGQVVDCRVCGDPNSVLRFAFIEFMDDEGAKNALSKAGTMFGFYPVKVLPSKTAIAPVNPTLLPRSEDEREMCSRTIYCTNIDKKVTHTDVKLFFEAFCGEVYRLRLLGDYHHSTRIAFVEFVMAESAIAALNCSGAVMGSLPIRVSPSKTPVRPRVPRNTIQ